jgi:hypothetical protein
MALPQTRRMAEVHMWGGGRRRRQQTIEASLEMARPYERMLDGSYLDAVCANGEAMPPWVWLNKLTHCAESELTLIASRPLAFANRPDLHGWARAVSFLAAMRRQHRRAAARGLAPTRARADGRAVRPLRADPARARGDRGDHATPRLILESTTALTSSGQ